MHFWWNNITFDQQYLNKGLKTPNLENLSLDLIFIDNICQNIKKIFSNKSPCWEFTQNRTEIDKNFHCAVYVIRTSAKKEIKKAYKTDTQVTIDIPVTYLH